MNYLVLQITMNSLSFSKINMDSPFFSRIYHKFIIFFAKSLWMLSEITVNSLSFSRIYSEFTVFGNSLPFSRNRIWIPFCFREFIMNSFSVSRIRYEFTFFYANTVWIRFLLLVFTIHLANISWIHNLFREFPMKLL